MKLSDDGIRLIISFEGKLRKIGDGKYVAYRCPAGVWTIFAGCTEGVKEGMICTEAEGEAMFRKELAKHEAAVNRLVTVEISQNEFDAMVSLCYNIGAGALGNSTVLKRLNKGDRSGAAQAFAMWNKAGGKVLPGLVSRRSREAALFLKPATAPDGPWMPQRVEPTPEPLSRKIVATVTSAGGAGAAYVSTSGIPPVPPKLTETVSNVGAWKGLGVGAGADPLTLFGLAVVLCAVAWFAYDKWRAE